MAVAGNCIQPTAVNMCQMHQSPDMVILPEQNHKCMFLVWKPTCRDPKASDEEEYLENLFDVLCTCLMQPVTRTAFFEAEGVL